MKLPPRERLTLERIRELLTEGRKVRLAVEKDIAEMHKIPHEEAVAKVK